MTMKKLAQAIMLLLVLCFFSSSQISGQVLRKNSWRLDNPKPEPGLGGNAITDLGVQELLEGSIIWAGTGGGLSRLNTATDTWQTYTSAHNLGKGGVSAIAISDTIIWVATGFDTLPDQGDLPAGGGLSYSLDDGQTWTHIAQPGATPVQNITYDIALIDSSVWIASFGGGLQKSTNRGETWEVVPPDSFFFNPGKNLNHRAFSVINAGGELWVGTAEGVNKSVDGGLTWANFNHQNQDKAISGNFIVALGFQSYADKNVIWAASWPTTSESGDETEFYAVSRSDDGGLTWSTYLESEMVHNFAFDDSVIFAASDNGLFKSTDDGKTWYVFPPCVDYQESGQIERIYTTEFYSAAVSNPHVLWAGSGDGLARTDDNGLTCTIYRASVNAGENGEPRTFAFPNPFSPLRHNRLGDVGHVRIQYKTTKSTTVSIKIYDFAMDLVTTVIQGESRGIGNFNEIWDGKNDKGDMVANGVYFYSVELDGDGTHWGKIMILN
ncbi:hypothetical protein JXJ21_19600 [candidate division KSB1 bacterium]|nr:hypothetical protein [candidate division KSB1 bacterium]